MLDLIKLIVRIGPAAMLFAFHGLSKLMSAFNYLVHGSEWRFITGVENLGFPFAPFFAVAAALSESIGSWLIAVGLFTRYASVFVLTTMAVASYRHLTSDFRFELAAMYGFWALLFIFLSPGKYSLDRWIRKKQ